jgi:hypothetical protein
MASSLPPDDGTAGPPAMGGGPSDMLSEDPQESIAGSASVPKVLFAPFSGGDPSSAMVEPMTDTQTEPTSQGAQSFESREC